MNRRSLLKGALCGAGAAIGATALGKGVDAHEAAPVVMARVESVSFVGGTGYTSVPSVTIDPYCESFVEETIAKLRR